MKKIIKFTFIAFSILLIFTLSFTGPQKESREKQSLETTPINISRSGSDSDYPLIRLDGSGVPYVIWIEYLAYRYIYFAHAKTGTWSTPQRVIDIYHSSAEAGFPSFSTSSSGMCHVTFQDVRGEYYDIYHLSYTTSWSSLTNVSSNVGGSAYSSCSVNPVDNFLFIVWMDGMVREWEIFLKYRNPNGSWGSVQTLPIGTGYMPDIVIDGNGTAHLVWITRWGSSTIWYSRNSDPKDASKWTQPVVVRNSTGLDWTYPKIGCDGAGNVFVVWIDSTQGNQEIFLRKRTAGGSWQEEVNVSQTSGFSTDAAVAVNKNNGNVYVAWAEDDGGKWDIYVKYYTDSWKGPSNISNNAARSCQPSIAIDNSGKVHIAYADEEPGNWEIMYLGAAELPSPIPKPFPPLDLALETKLDSTQTKKINTLTWKRNPDNRNINIINHNVYRKEYQEGDSEFKLIATLSGDTFKYDNSDLPLNKKYTYACTAIGQGGKESDLSETVTEDNTFPPLNVTLTTVINNSLFQKEKINVITWQKNPLNEPITVDKYNIYRKKIEQNDNQYKHIASLDANASEYLDRKLPFNEKYSYVLTTIDTNGNESKRSSAVKES